MVEFNQNLEIVLKAIADPIRREILSKLREGPASIGQIAEPYDMSFAGTAKHVNILVNADLVRKTKIGRSQICSLNAKPLEALQTWLDEYSQFWNNRLDALSSALEEFENER